jgi:8-oxo-dGTP pyrophosphatase MutT (NUDIX family)
MQHRKREVVRALIVSPDSRLLLVNVILKDKSIWITPGGGMENNEDMQSALRRELNEEIGRDSWNIGPVIWTRTHTFDFEGETLTQHENFHWIQSEWFAPPHEMPDAHENQYFGGFRWWTVEELLGSKDVFAPRRIAAYFQEAIDKKV